MPRTDHLAIMEHPRLQRRACMWAVGAYREAAAAEPCEQDRPRLRPKVSHRAFHKVRGFAGALTIVTYAIRDVVLGIEAANVCIGLYYLIEWCICTRPPFKFFI